MRWRFNNRKLQALHKEGRSRKYRLQQSTLKKFFMRVQQLEAAKDIHDLWKTPALNFEKLEGHENRYSVRVDDRWRLELEILWENAEKTVGEILIEELSLHYGD